MSDQPKRSLDAIRSDLLHIDEEVRRHQMMVETAQTFLNDSFMRRRALRDELRQGLFGLGVL